MKEVLRSYKKMQKNKKILMTTEERGCQIILSLGLKYTIDCTFEKGFQG